MDLNLLLALIREGESERVEFKKMPTKTLHHEIAAFANADGGYLIIGIEDNGTITGIDVKNALELVTGALQSIIPPPHVTTHKMSINRKDILVIAVGKSPSLCSVGGVVYIRIGTSARPLSVQEILMLSSEQGTFTWDEAPAATDTKANSRYIDWFFLKILESRGKQIAPKDRNRYLRSAGAFRKGRLTNAGTLFFTEATDEIPHAKIRIIGMQNDEPAWSREYEGPVWQVIEAAYTDITREIKKIELIVGTRRVRIEEYPPRALREALINAVAHRNYVISADIRIFLYPDRIEIRNPGGLMPGVDILDPEHIPRNPALSNLLYDTGFIERYGFGIRLIQDEVKRHPLCSVEFVTTANRFRVIFTRKRDAQLDATDRRILNAVHEPSKSSEVALALGMSKPAIIHRLKNLKELGLIKKEGSGAHTRYCAAS